MRGAYYNEFDPFVAEWLRNLIKAGLIADGEVDERSIKEVKPDDVQGFVQCHFFAGIGGWSYALRLAGWPDDRPVWTGSCPCQPFSAAGKRKGFDDDRHLWPVWFDLIRECRPPVLLGENVARATEWLGLVRSDLEGLDYAVGAMPIEAASAGAFHKRDRYWFVAMAEPWITNQFGGLGDQAKKKCSAPSYEFFDIENEGSWGPYASYSGSDGSLAVAERRASERHGHEMVSASEGLQGATRQQWLRHDVGDGFAASIVADAESELVNAARERRGEGRAEHELRGGRSAAAGASGMGDTNCAGLALGPLADDGRGTARDEGPTPGSASANIEWLPCSDGKARPTQPGIFPLAHAVSGRMVVRRTVKQGDAEVQEENYYSRIGALRGIGNAIDAVTAAAFIEAVMIC